MEDPNMEEWEMVNYHSSSSSCLQDHDQDEYEDDVTEKSSSKMSWLLNKTLSIGKKLVVTGVVVSSAPIVVPPLVFISALGVAASVPFGFVYASYACTDKLMSKLLMPPASTPSSLMIDYDEREEEDEEDGIEKEEMEQVEALKDEIESRIELVGFDDDREAVYDDQVLEVEGIDESYNEIDRNGLEIDDVEMNRDLLLEQVEDEEKVYAELNVDGNDLEIDDKEMSRDLLEQIKDEESSDAVIRCRDDFHTEHIQILKPLDVRNTIVVPESASSGTNDHNLIVEQIENAEAGEIDTEMKFATVVPKEKSSSSKRGKRKKSYGKRKEAEREKRQEREKQLLLLEETKNSSQNNNKEVVEEEKKIVDDADDLGNSEKSLGIEAEPMDFEMTQMEGNDGSDEANVSDTGFLVASETKVSFESNLSLDGEKSDEIAVIEEQTLVIGVSGDVGAREHITFMSEDLNIIQTSSAGFGEDNVMIDDDLGKTERLLDKEEEPVDLETTLKGEHVGSDEANMSDTGFLVASETKTSFESILSLNGEKPSQEVVVEEEQLIIEVSSDADTKEHITLESEIFSGRQTSSAMSGEKNVTIDDGLGKSERSLEKEEELVGLKTTVQLQSVLGDGVVSEADMSSTGWVASKTAEEKDSTPMAIADDVEKSLELAPPSSTGVLEFEVKKETLELKEEEHDKIPYRDETTLQGQSVSGDGVFSEAETAEEYYSIPRTSADDASLEFVSVSSTGKIELELNIETSEFKKEGDLNASFRDEEKIWKEMEAIRVIVGFRAPARSSYFEELKALYLFTGIEPPSLFEDPSDLSEFSNKLSFLKSVIGLK